MQNKNKATLPELSLIMQKVVKSYLNCTEATQVSPVGVGNINDTYLVTSGAISFILQRINPDVFPEPEKVVDNSYKVSAFIRQRSEDRSTVNFPAIIPTLEGKNCCIDEENNIWRAQEFIQNGKVYEHITTTQQAIQIGQCLARFHKLVEDLPATELDIVLPGFHDLPQYLRKYDSVLATSGQSSSEHLQYCFECVKKYRLKGDFFEQSIHRGDVSLRIIHGDPKVSNVIFNTETSLAITMIDLDTVGPGLLLFDLGDCLRSCCSSGGENEFGKMAHCDSRMVAAVLRGYISNQQLTCFEENSIYESLYLITFELGLRFLTDYLQGNCYFKVNHSDENLHRAVTQFNLVDSIYLQQKEIRAIISQILNNNK